MTDTTYRAFCEARKGSPLADGEFEATYSRIEAAWIEKVEAAVREQIAQDIDAEAEAREAPGLLPDESYNGRTVRLLAANGLREAARIARGEQP